MSVLPTNGVISRIDASGAPDADGNPTWVNGGAISAECVVDGVTSGQRFTLGAAVSDCDAVIYVALDDLPAGQQLREGFRVVAAQDEDPDGAITYVVKKRDFKSFYELTHFEIFCKKQ